MAADDDETRACRQEPKTGKSYSMKSQTPQSIILIPFRFYFLLMLSCLIFLTAAAQASASLISIQLKGQVDSVVGNPFGFGLSGGEPFSALFTYDPSTPPAFSRTDQNIYFQTTSYAVTV